MDLAQISDVLAECGFFDGLDAEDLERVAGLCTLERFEAGNRVFRQGELGEHLYVICEGRVCLERSRSLGDRKGNVVLAVLGKGNAFGGWGTLVGDEHTLMSTAICLHPTEVVSLNGKRLREVMLENGAFGFNVLERLCFLLHDRLRNVLDTIEKL